MKIYREELQDFEEVDVDMIYQVWRGQKNKAMDLCYETENEEEAIAKFKEIVKRFKDRDDVCVSLETRPKNW